MIQTPLFPFLSQSFQAAFHLLTFIIVQIFCLQIKENNHVLQFEMVIVYHSDKCELQMFVYSKKIIKHLISMFKHTNKSLVISGR